MNQVKIFNPDGTLKKTITPEELSARPMNATQKKKHDEIKAPPVKRADYSPVKNGTQ